MCGRFTLRTPAEQLMKLFDLVEAAPLKPRYNLAPTQPAPIIRADAQGQRRLELARWGLVPHWADDVSIGHRMINARREGIADKPAFRQAIRRRRCLVPADGFYEWKKTPRGKQPYLLQLASGHPMALAGLWETWDGPDGPLTSFTIITGPAPKPLTWLHDRMPIILHRQDYARWLDPGVTEPAEVEGLLRPFEADALHIDRVSPVVNNPRHDVPECVEPLN